MTRNIESRQWEKGEMVSFHFFFCCCSLISVIHPSNKGAAMVESSIVYSCIILIIRFCQLNLRRKPNKYNANFISFMDMIGLMADEWVFKESFFLLFSNQCDAFIDIELQQWLRVQTFLSHYRNPFVVIDKTSPQPNKYNAFEPWMKWNGVQ